GRVVVDEEEAPHLDGSGAMRMPYEDGTRLVPVERSIRENCSNKWPQTGLVAMPLAPLLETMPEVFLDFGIVLERLNVLFALRHDGAVHPVPLRKVDPDVLGAFELGIAPPPGSGRARAGSDADAV